MILLGNATEIVNDYYTLTTQQDQNGSIIVTVPNTTSFYTGFKYLISGNGGILTIKIGDISDNVSIVINHTDSFANNLEIFHSDVSIYSVNLTTTFHDISDVPLDLRLIDESLTISINGLDISANVGLQFLENSLLVINAVTNSVQNTMHIIKDVFFDPIIVQQDDIYCKRGIYATRYWNVDFNHLINKPFDTSNNNIYFNGNVGIGAALDVSGDILPNISNTFNLGSSDRRWMDIYLSGTTIDISGTRISRHTNGNIMVHDASGNMLGITLDHVDISGIVLRKHDNSVIINDNSGNLLDGRFNNITVNGDLTVNGTSTIVNSTTVTVSDPIITLGSDTSDNKDRGIEFKYSSKRGFFGYDNSQDAFIFLTDASNNSEVFSGTYGLLIGDISGNSSTVTNGVYTIGNQTIDGIKTFSSNVGIGTNTPLARLDVCGNVLISNNSNYQVRKADNTVSNLINIGTNNDIRIYGQGGALHINPDSSISDTRINQGNTADITMYNGDNIRMSINDTGIGINKTPSTSLDVSGNIYMSNGTAAAPVLAFSSDPNTGIYRPGASIMGLVTGGVERMRVDASGNVGIGSSAPSQRLDVNGNLRVAGQVVSAATQGTAPFVVGSTTLVPNLNCDLLDGLDSSKFMRTDADTSTTGTLTGTRLISTVATGTAPLTVTSTTLVPNLNAALLNGQPASYYTSYANLTGVPTIPAAQIQSDWNQTNTAALDFIKNKPSVLVSGQDITASQITLTGGDASYNSSGTDAGNRTNTYINFGFAGAVNDWAYLRQIGGTNAYHLALDFHDDGNDARFSIRDVQSTANPDVVTTRFSVDSTGTTVGGNLNVGGSLTVGGATVNGSLNCGNNTIYFNNNGAGLYWGQGYSRIYDNGNLMISTDDQMDISAPTGLYISDGVYCPGVNNNFTTSTAANVRINTVNSALYRSTSSRKYKTAIEDLPDECADKILSCRPVQFKSLCADDDKDKTHFGLIAEEVAKILPELVSFGGENNDVPEGVEYDRFVSLLISVVKRQRDKITTMEARLAAIEEKLGLV